MPRVLIFAPTVGRGGVSLVVRKVFRGLAECAPSNWQFDVLGQRWNEIGEAVAYPSEWGFTQLAPLSPEQKMPAHPHQFPWLWQQCEMFYQHLASVAGEYDLIYCPSSWWAIRANKWTLPVPFITHIPDFAFDQIDMGLLAQHFRVASQLTSYRADFTIFPADYWRNHAINYYGFAPDKTQTISHSADFVAEDYHPTPEEGLRVRARYGLPEQYVLAFHVASSHKDPETILLGQLHARRNSPHVPPLVIAGIETERFKSNAPDAQPIMRIRQVIREIGATLGKDLFILGGVPESDIAGLFAGATVSINASRMEGDLSGVTFNAFMARNPHIYSDLPVYVDRIGRDALGWCFPVGDAEALGNCLIAACENRDEAMRRALEAYKFAHQRTVRDVAAEYLEVFDRYLSRTKA